VIGRVQFVHTFSRRIRPTAACESRAPRRDTKYSEPGIFIWRMRTPARSLRSTSQRTHMRGTPMAIAAPNHPELTRGTFTLRLDVPSPAK
jgi:hypothetical protein